MDNNSAAFRLPVGSKLIVTCPDSSGNSTQRQYHISLPAGEFLNVIAAASAPSRAGHTTEAMASVSPSTPSALRTVQAVSPLSPTPSADAVSAGVPKTPKVHGGKVPCYDASDFETESESSEDSYGRSYFTDVEIDEEILGNGDPNDQGCLVFKYKAFAHLAHPDELSWDDRRGCTDIYVVTRGRRVGIFADWSLVHELTNSVPNAVHQHCRSIDKALNVYQAAYDNVAGHIPLAVVPAKVTISNPIIDDNLKSIRGHDLDIRVFGDPVHIRVFPISRKSSGKVFVKTPQIGRTASQVLSPSQAGPKASPGAPGPSRRR
ncbi:hypothetical protein VKT23_019223 [Stygiomarasmius scandens]|uniref:Ribonuclease H1 N-terminal domain-containing protein n=1 Tax=Marasmiellus scandens TaxID=2682957 RepID=A0ABR1IR72_9AGAR